MKDKIFITIILTLSSMLSVAQTDSTSVVSVTDTVKKSATDTTIKRDIEVVREYTPVIKEAGKVNTMPELKDVNTKKIEVNYKVWSSTFKPKSDILPTLDYATNSLEENKDSKEGYVRIGAGNYKSFLGELYTPLRKTGLCLIDFFLLHNSSFGNVELKQKNYPQLFNDVKSKGLNNDNKAKISFLRSLRRKKEISAYGEFGYDRFNYYGLDDAMVDYTKTNIDSKDLVYKDDYQKQRLLTAGANVRFRTKEFQNQWKYDFQLTYNLLNSKTKVTENSLHTDLSASYKMKNSSINLDLEVYNIFLKKPNEKVEFWDFEKSQNLSNYAVIKFCPSYSFIASAGELHLGVLASFGIKQGRKASFNPNVTGSVKIIDKIWYAYAGLTGDYKVNSLKSVIGENLYLSPDMKPLDTYTPLDVYLGTKVNVFKTLNIDFNVGYKIINNPYFYVNKKNEENSMVNTFDIVYDKNVGLFNCGGSINYNFRNKLDFSLKGQFMKWKLDKQKEAWMTPKGELQACIAYVPTNYLRFALEYYLVGGRKALVDESTVKMKNINDLAFSANYKVMSFLDVFVKFDNIINQKYETWYGYPAHHFNFLAGLTLTF